MIVVAAVLVAFGVADLVAQAPSRGERVRRVGAALAAAAATGALVALAGGSLPGILAGGVLAAVGPSLWQVACRRALAAQWPTAVPLAMMGLALGGAIAVSGSASDVAGPLHRWFTGLDVRGPRSVDQLVVAMGAAIFLVASANQLVRLVLQTAGTPAVEGESALKGGRFLGPLERLFIAAMVLAGELTGAAIVVAAKGALRLPEIRSSEALGAGAPDSVTEYFLIGTFTSLLIAGGLAALVLAVS